MLVGVLTAIVTTKQTPALIGALILLAALSAVLAVMQQHSTQSPPATAPASDPAVFDPSPENPYGAPFFTRHAFRLSTFPYPASGLLPVPRAESGDLVNRDGERELLDRTLRADRSDVIVMHGPPDAGKSTLVSRALRDPGLSETMVRRYNYPGDRFDAKTLCEDLDTNTRSATGPRSGEDF